MIDFIALTWSTGSIEGWLGSTQGGTYCKDGVMAVWGSCGQHGNCYYPANVFFTCPNGLSCGGQSTFKALKNIKYSIDGGKTWTKISNGNTFILNAGINLICMAQ